eukprot:TRINITY_DN67963_c6_g1_i1.p1 TRINITY_DN67963_c6_g1~~TRINITY_DN67963_c6_g1_i1.p1  ORF type:complete len:265 (+),score=23.92 TRINITY_DN67963_c6_g1_i1:33-797(+)
MLSAGSTDYVPISTFAETAGRADGAPGRFTLRIRQFIARDLLYSLHEPSGKLIVQGKTTGQFFGFWDGARYPLCSVGRKDDHPDCLHWIRLPNGRVKYTILYSGGALSVVKGDFNSAKKLRKKGALVLRTSPPRRDGLVEILSPQGAIVGTTIFRPFVDEVTDHLLELPAGTDGALLAAMFVILTDHAREFWGTPPTQPPDVQAYDNTAQLQQPAMAGAPMMGGPGAAYVVDGPPGSSPYNWQPDMGPPPSPYY